MEFLPEKSYKRVLVIAFYIFLVAAGLFLFFKYLLSLIFPFIISWLIALAIRPMIVILHRRTKLPIKILSLVFVVLVLAFVGTLVFLLLDKIFYELSAIIANLNENSDTYIQNAFSFVNGLLEKIPFLKSFGSQEELFAALSDFVGNLLGKLSTDVPGIIGRLITVLPNVFFVSLILVMASYYFCADYDIVTSFILSLLPKKARGYADKVKINLKDVGIKVLKGYLLTMMITFLELYIGFWLIGVDYAFTVALITAIVDVLPVLGVGTVLVPWAVFKLFAGLYYQGFGLLILFAVVSVVRQIIQPKIIGTSIGLHPLATLFAMYLGFRVCGIIGLISFPVLVIVVKEIILDVRKTA